MHRIILTALLLAMLLVGGCKKKESAKPPVLNAAPILPGPSATELAAEKHNALLDKLEPFPIPEQNGTVAIGPDGEKWTRYASGIMIHDIIRTDGRKPHYGQSVEISYVGTFPGKPDKPFDSNKDFTFILGTKDVVKGLNIGVSNMAIGSKRRILIPADLAYGVKGNLPGGIVPGQALIFEVEMLAISGEELEMPKVDTVTDLHKMGPFLPTQPDTAPASQPK